MSIARFARIFVSASALAMVSLVSSAASATPENEAEASRISSAGHTLKWNWKPGGKADRYGHGEAIVNASIDKVRAAVLDFNNYRAFNPSRFSQSNVQGHPAEGLTDVKMEFKILGGVATMWQVLRFGQIRAVRPGYEVLEGKFVDGNVKDANVVWTVKEVDANFTIVKCDILVKPDLPAPQSAIDEELRDAAQQAVDGVRSRTQGNSNWVRWTGNGS